MQTGVEKDVQEHLDKLMREEGTIGYCLINFDGKFRLKLIVKGVPIKYQPKRPDNKEDEDKAIQYAALISDLMAKTK